jgi:hypothetical protein
MSNFDRDDGFDNFNLEQIGQHSGAFGGARLLKFNTDQFVTREGDVVGPDRPLISLGLIKLVQKFVGKKLMSSTVIPSDKKMPDIEKMNEEAPREEWGVNLNGDPVGPYVGVLMLKLLEESKFNRFAFVTSSIGGGIAVGDLCDKIKIARRLDGPNMTAVVSLRTTLFKIRYAVAPRKRPHFEIVGWRKLGGEGDGGEQLPKPEVKPIAGPTTPAAATGAGDTQRSPAPRGAAAQLEAFAGAPSTAPSTTPATAPSMTLGTPVQPPTLQKETGDEVPF